MRAALRMTSLPPVCWRDALFAPRRPKVVAMMMSLENDPRVGG
jgi:hypothetical protein